MSFDVKKKLSEYQKEQLGLSKAKIQLSQQINRVSSAKKINPQATMKDIKKDVQNNQQRIKVKSTISGQWTRELPQSPMKSPTKFRFAQSQQSFVKSPLKESQSFQSVRVVSPRENLDNSSVKLYSSKYQKVLSEEQGAYYSLLQAKLDQLSEIIGNSSNYQKQIQDIDNLINQSRLNSTKNSLQKQIEKVTSEKRIIQTDLQNISHKISRFSEY
ncbi:hypothetical protein pb186bvf_010365 [Paramecium bursaria]